MNDPWTWTTVWGWTVGVGGRLGGTGQGEIGTTVIEKTIKYLKNKIKL